MGKNAVKNKMFKKIYKDLIKDLENKQILLDSLNSKTIMMYKNDVESNLEKFINCDKEVLEHINLYKVTFKNLYDDINWDLLHNLYFTTIDKENLSQELVQRSKTIREKLQQNIKVSQETTSQGSTFPDISSILSSPMFSEMISKVLPVVQEAVEGKDLSSLNMNDVITGFITKDPSKCGGLDINKIIEESTNKLKNM